MVNSRWEPVIEPSLINAEFSNNALASPLMMMHLNIDNSELLINISTQMIA